jgi:hypothetical protein
LTVGFATGEKGRHVTSRKTYRPGEIIGKLRQAEVLLGEGEKVPEVVKALGISACGPSIATTSGPTTSSPSARTMSAL